MNLPFIKKKNISKDFFLVLLFSSGKIRAILFEKGENLTILNKEEELINKPLDTLESNELIEVCDIVISNIEQRLSSDVHIEKTIFALPQRWVQDSKIKSDHLVSLKHVCEALELAPIGFIVSIEALTAYLHAKEGAPVTAIFVEVGEKHVTVSIVKNGTILFVDEKEIRTDVVSTTQEILLSQEKVDVLPSKIILLNFDNAKKTQQHFLTHSWSKSLSFLHIPQVVVLDPEIESQAVITGVANQMGFEGMNSISPKVYQQKAIRKMSQNLEEDSEKIAYNGESVGFFQEEDVKKKKKEIRENTETVIPETTVSPEDINLANKAEDDLQMEHFKNKRFSNKLNFPFSLQSIIGILTSGRSLQNKLYLYPVIGAIAFIGFIFSYYFFFETATATIYLEKKVIEKSVPITFSREKETNVVEGILNIKIKKVEVSGEESKNATGVKKTGEKAKGEVIIYNKTENKKTFPKGTVLLGPNNLSFILSDEVSIASTSAFSTSFSNAKVKVESFEFGKEYNLPSNTNFSIEDEPTVNFFARNESAFSGGTSKEITVISQEDLLELDTALLSKLKKEVMSNISSEKEPEEEMLKEPLGVSFSKKIYSGKVDTEASEVRLTGTVVVEVGVYNTLDLLQFAKETVKKESDPESKFSEKDSKALVKNIQISNGDIKGVLDFSAVFLPIINTEDLSKKIAGKNEDRVIEILTSDKVKKIEVEFTRSIPFMPRILPFHENNIQIQTKAF